MRIGIDARMYSSNFTGIGRYVYELVRNLREIDQKNEYILFLNEPEFREVDLPELDIAILRRAQDDSPSMSKILVNAKHYSWAEQTKFLKILNRAQLDLMHFTHFNAPIFYNRPSVVTIHDLTLSFYPGKKMTKPWHRWGYHFTLNNIVKKARKVIAVSENTKNDLMKLLGAPEEKIAVIYEGGGEEFKVIKDEGRLAAVREKWDLSGDFVLYTGVWRNHKNLTGLVEAFGKLVKRQDVAKNAAKECQGATRVVLTDAEKKAGRPSTGSGRQDLKLVITGREDPAYPEVKKAVRDFGLEKQVVFTGLVSKEELVALYNAAKMYVLPSFYEGFGLSVLEAFACGTPVICSNAACLPEIVGKDEAGETNAFLFNPKKVDELAEKMLELLKDDELAEKLVKRGLERVEDFDFRKMAERSLRIYEGENVQEPNSKFQTSSKF